MTPKKQKFIILGLFGAFLVIMPLIIGYSMGYRITSDFKIVETGGIYLKNDEPDTTLYVNGIVKDAAGLIDSNLLIKNLKPGLYSIKLEKENFRPWKKSIQVEEKQVEVGYPLLVPEKIEPEEIKKFLIEENVVRGIKKKVKVLNDDYLDVVELFKNSRRPPKRFFPEWYTGKKDKITAGRDIKLKGKVLLSQTGNRIYVKWIGREKNLPFFIGTMEKKQIYTPDMPIASFDFFPGRNDSMLVRFKNGQLMAVEIDTRFGVQNTYRILKYCDSFLVDEHNLYFFSGAGLYSVDFD